MKIIFSIFFAGGLGSVCRFTLAKFIEEKTVPNYWGTLSVNILGCFLIGIIFHAFSVKFSEHETLRIALMTGFLGGFTTFSAFSLESIRFLQEGKTMMAFSYIGMSLIFCLVGTALGVALAKSLL